MSSARYAEGLGDALGVTDAPAAGAGWWWRCLRTVRSGVVAVGVGVGGGGENEL